MAPNSSVTVGGSVKDQATVSGGDSPSGTVTFDLYGNNSASGFLTNAVAQGLNAVHLSGATHPDPDELDRAMALAGCATVESIDRTMLLR